MAWKDDVSVADEGLHPRTTDGWWNESTYFGFVSTEHNIGGMIYYYFRPNQGQFMGGPMIWDPSGDEIGTCRHWGWNWHVPLNEGADVFDFSLENGFSVRTIEPQVSYHVQYDAGGCEIDLIYTAAREPYYMRLDKENVNAGMIDLVQAVDGEITTGHYEQYGYMSGTITLDGEVMRLTDVATLRDRTWGPRAVTVPMVKARTGYQFGIGSPDSAFHVFSVADRPWEEDPVIDAVDTVTSGFYVRDGVVGRLVTGTRRCVERGPDGRPIRELVEATDDLGRTLHAEGRNQDCLKWPGVYGDFMIFNHNQRWDFDGNTDAPGQLNDYMMCRQYRRFMLSHTGAPMVGSAG
jgi:hypothetical protein